MGIFGSYARNEQTPASDLDLMVEFEDNTPNLTDIKEFLRNEMQTVFHIPVDICREKYIKPLFRQYLQFGYFPYYKEDLKSYSMRLLNTVNAVIETDLPAVENIEFSSAQKLKRLLTIIATMTPFTPNMTNLGSQVEIQRSNLPKSLILLERARLLGLLRSVEKSPDDLSKPSKIFLDNPNLAFALGENNPNTGNLRETFFYNQLRAVAKVNSTAKGDFIIDNTSVFEVGGKGKKFTQIADIPDSYLAIDDAEVGFGNKIPLWLFGFLY